MRIDDKHQLDIESNIRSSQGVDFERERRHVGQRGNRVRGGMGIYRDQKRRGGFCAGGKNNDRFILFFTMFMPVNCLILQYFWLDTIIENKFEYFFQTLTMFFGYIMDVITYYQAVTVKNVPQKKAPPVITDRDPFVSETHNNNKACESCGNFWKPMRTSHCSTCNSCTLRMDHHCPWIVGCVGLRNHRAFYLFTVYMGFGSIQYLYRSLMYFLYLSDREDFWENSFFFYVYWFFTNLVLVPVCMMLVGLATFHSSVIMTNQTTLDQIKGNQIKCPCVPDADYAKQGGLESEKNINLFDGGIFANIAQFFSNQRFLFWWPCTNNSPNDGTSYPLIPKLTADDALMVVFSGPDKPPMPLEGKVDSKLLIQNFYDELDQLQGAYKNKKLLFDGRLLDLDPAASGDAQEGVDAETQQAALNAIRDLQTDENANEHLQAARQSASENLTVTLSLDQSAAPLVPPIQPPPPADAPAVEATNSDLLQ